MRFLSVILATAIRYLMPLILTFSIFILIRGHNDPGGGFAGGLVAAAAFALYDIAYGSIAARRLLRLEPRTLIGAGLLTALISGLVTPVLFNRPFLTHFWSDITLPAIGHPGTPLLFDIGVYLVVVGVTLTILFALSED